MFDCPAYTAVCDEYEGMLFSMFGGCREAFRLMNVDARCVRDFLNQNRSSYHAAKGSIGLDLVKSFCP